MGLKKMVSRIPALRYIREVRQGTEEQRSKADELNKRAIPLVTSLKASYERNHVSELVDKAFGRP